MLSPPPSLAIRLFGCKETLRDFSSLSSSSLNEKYARLPASLVHEQTKLFCRACHEMGIPRDVASFFLQKRIERCFFLSLFFFSRRITNSFWTAPSVLCTSSPFSCVGNHYEKEEGTPHCIMLLLLLLRLFTSGELLSPLKRKQAAGGAFLTPSAVRSCRPEEKGRDTVIRTRNR